MSTTTVDAYLSAKMNKKAQAISSYGLLNSISFFKRRHPFDIGQKAIDIHMGYNDIYITYIKDKNYFSGGNQPGGGTTIYYI